MCPNCVLRENKIKCTYWTHFFFSVQDGDGDLQQQRPRVRAPDPGAPGPPGPGPSPVPAVGKDWGGGHALPPHWARAALRHQVSCFV